MPETLLVLGIFVSLACVACSEAERRSAAGDPAFLGPMPGGGEGRTDVLRRVSGLFRYDGETVVSVGKDGPWE